MLRIFSTSLIPSLLPVLAAFTLAMATPARADLPAEAGLDDLLRYAAANSPGLQSAFSRWQAAVERIPQVRALPDPMISYGYFVERMDTRQTVRLAQMFPWFGKLDLRGEIAAEAALAAARRVEAETLEVRAAVVRAYAEHLYVRRARDLVAENHRLLEQLIEVALRQYQSGQASQADVLRLQTEADTLATEIESFQERQIPVAARLNSILGRSPSAPLPVLRTDPLPQLPRLDPAELRARIGSHPLIEARAREISRAEHAQRLARRERRPDVMVGVEYMDNRGMARDEVMGMVSINLPVWRERYRAADREAAADLRAAEHEYTALHHELESEALLALYEAREADRRLRLFNDQLAPRARQTFELAEAGYRTGQLGFLDLLEAQRSLLDFQTGALRAETDLWQSLAAWERAVGTNDR